MSNEYLDKDGLGLVAEQIKKKTTSFVGTAAQWDSQQNNYPKGTIVALTDDVDNTYESGEYSTNETTTGKVWIDGKPIYRRVVVQTVNTYTDADVRRLITANISSNIDTLVSGDGYAEILTATVGTGTSFKLGNMTISSDLVFQSSVNMNMLDDVVSINLMTRTDWNVTSVKFVAWIEYTKAD